MITRYVTGLLLAATAGVGAAEEVPFARSLQIAPPGPRVGADGLDYTLTLAWSARPGAAAYRVFMWTDAVRSWYRVTQTSATTADARAFRSGCTVFVVVAVADVSASTNALAGIDTSNVVRFPLSANQKLCPDRP